MTMKPEELKFAHSHEWAHLADHDGQQIATIGISAHAVEALSDVVYMELPEVGSEVTAGAAFGEVESVKATSDLFSPVTGKVIEVNTSLPDNLEVLGSDPYGEGWIIKVEITSDASIGSLLDFAAYEAICNE
jgi:glycine cleavage system H protein